MNTKIDKDPTQEILIGETASEDLSDETLENITGGLSLSSSIIVNSFSSKFVKFEPDSVIVLDDQLSASTDKSSALLWDA